MQILVALSLLSIVIVTVAAGALSGVTHIRGLAREAITVDGRLSQLASAIATQTLESRHYEAGARGAQPLAVSIPALVRAALPLEPAPEKEMLGRLRLPKPLAQEL